MNHCDAWNGTCPRCGNPNSWEGFSSWECPNENCSNFTKKQHDFVEKERDLQNQAELAQERKEQNPPAPSQGENLELDLDDPDAYLWGVYGAPDPPELDDGNNNQPYSDEELDDLDNYPYNIPQQHDMG